MTMPSPSIAVALADLAARESRKAIRSLTGTNDRHKGVHEARKSIRRLKSLLAMGAERFGDDEAPVLRRLSSLATGLSTLRDAHVALNIAHHVAGEAASDQWKSAIQRLEARRDSALDDALRRDPDFRRRRQQLTDVGQLIQTLPWETLTRRDIERALARSERRVDKAGQRAKAHPTATNLHRWRRRARRLRMQLEFWRKVLKTSGKPAHHRADHDKTAAQAMSRLSDALGARQDLRALRKVLRRLDPAVPEALFADIRTALKQAG